MFRMRRASHHHSSNRTHMVDAGRCLNASCFYTAMTPPPPPPVSGEILFPIITGDRRNINRNLLIICLRVFHSIFRWIFPIITLKTEIISKWILAIIINIIVFGICFWKAQQYFYFFYIFCRLSPHIFCSNLIILNLPEFFFVMNLKSSVDPMNALCKLRYIQVPCGLLNSRKRVRSVV